jgi:hypothetical protein
MSHTITGILASVFVAMLDFVTISEAQTMTGAGLNAQQENIVTIAAFTARGGSAEAESGPGRWTECRVDRQ